ncbi:DNA recombination/repair protein RecA, partial [Acinetobacter nosocomialis]
YLEEHKELADTIEKLIREQLLTTGKVVEDKDEEEPADFLDA